MIRKLVLGAGGFQRIEGAVHQDKILLPGIDLVFDLNEDWELESDYWDSIIACHVIEHLKDFLHFMNEAWRILKPGGTLYIETPSAHGLADLIWSDPTHVRPYTPHTWINYMTIEGVNQFHYTDKCWGNLHIETKDGVLRVHTMPIK